MFCVLYRVSSTLNYFVGEALYADENELTEKKLVKLYVIELTNVAQLLKDVRGDHTSQDQDTSVQQKETDKDSGEKCKTEYDAEDREDSEQDSKERSAKKPRLDSWGNDKSEATHLLSDKEEVTAKCDHAAPDEENMASLWEEIKSLLQTKPFVLDIDLDFFSTADPFRAMFSERQYELLKSIYRFDGPKDCSIEASVQNK